MMICIPRYLKSQRESLIVASRSSFRFSLTGHCHSTFSLGGKEAPAVQGLTGDQQFFLSFAQSWREKIREPALRQNVLTDSHAPDEYRADTVRNLDPWYEAFAVKPGQALFLGPKDRVRVW